MQKTSLVLHVMKTSYTLINYTLSGIIIRKHISYIPDRVYNYAMDKQMKNPIGTYIQTERKRAGLTQPEFALRSGLGLRFIRDLEQGKSTVRLDKVNQALTMFGSMAVPGRKPREGENE